MSLRRILACLTLLALCLTPQPGRAADLDVMIGQMLMAGFRGLDADADSQIARDIRERRLGGVILFDRDVALRAAERNIRSREQVRRLNAQLQSYAAVPLLVAVDQEGGMVQRLKPRYGFTGTPSAAALGASDDEAVAAAAMIMAHVVLDAGFNLNFAPVVDVAVNPDSPVIAGIERSFSADPMRVTRCAEIFLEQFARQGLIGAPKHFPGHGSARADSHHGLTDVTDTWTEKELVPYRELIAKGAPQAIMTAHIFNARLDPDHPATLSKPTITGLLREELGFEGVVVTDDLTMGAITGFYGRDQAIRLAIEAGADVLLFGNNITYDERIVEKAHAAVKRLVTEGTVSRDRIALSYGRIMRLKEQLTP